MTDMYKRYGIVIDDHNMSDEELRRLLVFFDSNQVIIDWHSPFRGFIIFITTEEIIEKSSSVSKYLGNGLKYNLFEMPRGVSRGSFAQQTWDWLEESMQFDTKLDAPDAEKN